MRHHILVRAHRFSYFLKNGIIPRSKLVCHTCDTSKCVNPKHLFIGTFKDNVRDCISKNRFASGDRHWMNTHPENRLFGEKNGSSKLNIDKIKKIRNMYSTGRYTQRNLAEIFGCTHPNIGYIVRREKWTKVN